MTLLGANYDLTLSGSDTLGMYSSPVTARPPRFPTSDEMHLRDTSARQKIRIALVDNTTRTEDQFGFGVWIKKVGSPTGYISAEWGSVPDTSSTPTLTTGGFSLNVESLTDEFTYVFFYDVELPATSPTERYVWVVLTGTFAVNASNYLAIASTPGAGYAQFNGTTWTTAGSVVLNGDSYPNVEEQFSVGQVFYAGEMLHLSALRVGLRRVGTLTGHAWIEILPVKDYESPIVFYEPEHQQTVYDTLVNDYVSGPNLTRLAASAMINLSSIPTALTEVEFVFNLPPAIEFCNRYAFVLKTDAALSEANNLFVAVDMGSVEYSEGTLLLQAVGDAAEGGNYRMGFGVLRFETYFTEDTSFADQLTALGDPPASCNDMRNWLVELTQTLRNFFPAVLPEAYGGTGEGNYAAGDMLYANAPNNLTRLTAGSTAGMTLTLDEDLLPVWAKAGGQVLDRLWNENGTQIDPGDVLVWDSVVTDPPGAATFTNTPEDDDLHFCGVAVEPIGDGERGFVCTQGIAQVRITGSCIIGDYLGLSHISRRAISQGAHPGPMRALQTGTDGELVYVYIDTGRVDSTPAGSTVVWWTTSAPPGWLFCAGQAVLRSAYPKLFAIIGTQFGIGDGTTTFNLPDLRGRVVIGLDNMGTGSAGRVANITDALGASGGTSTHTLTLPEIPTHRHFTGNTTDDGSGNYGPASPQLMHSEAARNTNAQYTDYAGSGQAHNNMQPSMRGNWIIKVV